MISKRIRRTATGVLGALSLCILPLAACSVLPTPEPVDIYLLPASAIARSVDDNSLRAWSLCITRPAANGQLAGPRILVIPEPNRVSVYKGANWHEPAALLVRNRLFDAFRMDGRVNALSTDEVRTFADFELVSDLNAFHSEYPQGEHGKLPEVVIRLDTRLIDTGSRRIVASRAFEAREPAADKSIPAVIAAFGIATDRLAAELVAWTITGADATQQTAETLPVTSSEP